MRSPDRTEPTKELLARLTSLGFDDEEEDEGEEEEASDGGTLAFLLEGDQKIQQILSPARDVNARGRLYVKQDDFLRSWIEHFWEFDAATTSLTEYESEAMVEALSSHHVLTVHTIPDRAGKRTNRFEVAVQGSAGTVLSLYANSNSEMNKWVTALGASMRQREQSEQAQKMKQVLKDSLAQQKQRLELMFKQTQQGLEEDQKQTMQALQTKQQSDLQESLKKEQSSQQSQQRAWEVERTSKIRSELTAVHEHALEKLYLSLSTERMKALEQLQKNLCDEADASRNKLLEQLDQSKREEQRLGSEVERLNAEVARMEAKANQSQHIAIGAGQTNAQGVGGARELHMERMEAAKEREEELKGEFVAVVQTLKKRFMKEKRRALEEQRVEIVAELKGGGS
jgi:hypothetical protein